MNLLSKLFKKPPKKEPTTLEVMQILGFTRWKTHPNAWVHKTFGLLHLNESTPVKDIAKAIYDSGYESAEGFSKKFKQVLQEIGQGKSVLIHP